MTQPISIVTACLNSDETIRDCLLAVKEQTLNAEHIIIDGGSQDNTIRIVQEISGDSIHLVSEPDNGIYDAMNKGIGLASNEVIGLLNSDDIYASPDVLEVVTRVFEDPNIDACYGDLSYVDRVNVAQVIRYWKAGEFAPQKFYAGWMPPHPTFFVRRRVYEKYGLFNLALGSAADYELMLRFLLKRGIKVAYIPKTLVKMRTGGTSNASLRNRLVANRMDRKAWQVNELRPYPWTLWFKPLRKLGQWVSRPQ